MRAKASRSPDSMRTSLSRGYRPNRWPTGTRSTSRASFVYLKHTYRGPAEYLTDPTSSGLACGPDLPTAILGGLFELVGGDAFLIHWVEPAPRPSRGPVREGGHVPVDHRAFPTIRRGRLGVQLDHRPADPGRDGSSRSTAPAEAPPLAVGLGCRPRPGRGPSASRSWRCAGPMARIGPGRPGRATGPGPRSRGRA